MAIIKIDAAQCDQCGHVWIPEWDEETRKPLPLRCAKCKTPSWNREKKPTGRPIGSKVKKSHAKKPAKSQTVETVKPQDGADPYEGQLCHACDRGPMKYMGDNHKAGAVRMYACEVCSAKFGATSLEAWRVKQSTKPQPTLERIR